MTDAQRPLRPRPRPVRSLALLVGGIVLCGFGAALPSCAGPPAQRLSAPSAQLTALGDQGSRGPFVLPLDTGAELDSAPPSVVDAASGELDNSDLFFDNRRTSGSALYTADHPMAVWSGVGSPDDAGCMQAISTAGRWSAVPVPGQVLCVQSTEGQVVALTVTRVDGEAVGFDVTVWG